MALTFSRSSGDNVNIGSGGSPRSMDNLTAFTVISWVYLTQDSVAGGLDLWAKGTFAAQDRRTGAFGFSPTNHISIQVDRATTDANAVSAANPLSLNTWTCVGWTYDESDGPRIFVGTLTSEMAEVTYDTGSPTVGSGASAGDSGIAMVIGSGTSNRAPGGRIAVFSMHNTRWTLAQIQAFQFDPRVLEDSVAFLHLGFNGTGTQPDWSGNGHAGTVTGATQSDHVPLGSPFGVDFGWSAMRRIISLDWYRIDRPYTDLIKVVNY